MASVIKIKRSGTSGAPGTLKLGEMAYSYLTYNGSNGGDRLYIGAGGVDGSGDANDIVAIGGKYFTDLLGGATSIAGTLTASKAIVVDANKKIDNLIVDNLDLNGNTLSTTNTDGDLVLSPNGNGDIDASSSVIKNVTTPSASHHAATKGYVDGAFVADAGGTMSGDLAMGGNLVTGLGAPSNAGDATRKSYVDAADALKLNLAGGTMSGAIAMGTNKITGMGDPTAAQDAATKAYVDLVSGAATMTFKADSAGTDTVELDADTFAILGGNVISTRKADNTVTIDLDNTSVTAGSYGSTTAIPTFTVDAQGRITAASTVDVATQLNLKGDTKAGNVSLLDSALSITGGEGINVIIDSAGVNGAGFVVSAELASETNLGVATFDGTDFTVSGGGDVTVNAERIQDIAGAMFSGNTETLITVTYQDADGTIDLVVDNDLSNYDNTSSAFITASSTDTLTNKTINGSQLVNGSVANGKLANSTITLAGDGGSNAVDLGDTLTVAGGTALTSAVSGDTVTINLDNTAVSAGTYGGASSVPQITVDAQGRITSASNVTVSTVLELKGDTKSGNVSLIDSALSIVGGEGINVEIDSATSGINGSGFIVSAEDASTTNKGVASFASAQFDVTSGAVSIKDATTSVKGIASFDTNHFTVSSGAVTIKGSSIENDDLAGSIANAKLANSTITAAGNTGSNAIDLGDTLTISGASSTAAATQAEPIRTSQSGDTLTLTARKASTTVIGMASFAAADFGVTSGAVTIKNGGVSNDQLAGSIANGKLVNSTITVTDGSTPSNIALGGTLTFAAGEGLDVAQAGGTVTFSGEDASTTNKGVASFSTDNFSVSSGAVTIKNGGVNADELAGTLDLSGKSVTLAAGEISNGELANSSVTINSNTLSLGGSLTLDTDDIGEGSNNLYFTTGRVTAPARPAVSATDAGGDGSFAYNSSTGVFTYTGPSAAETRAHFSGGTGVTYNSGTGAISIGQAVATTSDVTFNDLQVDGNAVVDGNLTVHGTTTTINSATVTTNDPLFNLADSNLTSDALDIGFIGKYFDTGQSRIERTGLFRDASDGKYKLFTGLFNDSGTLDSATNVVDVTGPGFTFADLQVGTLTADAFTGGYAGFDSDFAQKTTSDLTEGTNLYFTNERVDDRVNALITDGEGITTTYDDGAGTLTIAAEDATTTNKGVASFATANFTVSSGAVSSKDITFGSGSGSAAATLGETLTIAGGTGMSTTATGSTVTINGTNAAADGSTKGIASFNATHFTAASGNISANDITLTSGDDQNGAGSGIAATIGESFNIFGDFSQGIQTNITSGNLIVTGRNATVSSKGVASFSTFADSANDPLSIRQFTITSGDVALTTVDGGTY